MHRVDSRFAPSQWEMALLCNNLSHWLGVSLESAMYAYIEYALGFVVLSFVVSIIHVSVLGGFKWFIYPYSLRLLYWHCSNWLIQINGTKKSNVLFVFLQTNSVPLLLGHPQGWSQFHFFNSIPIPLFSIPIPIPLLPISFNSNSNSGHFNSNSNSNSENSNPISIPEMTCWSLRWNWLWLFMYIKSLLLISSVSYPLLNGYNHMVLVDPISIA